MSFKESLLSIFAARKLAARKLRLASLVAFAFCVLPTAWAESPALRAADGFLVHPPVPGLTASGHYQVRVRSIGGEWRSAFAWETACKTIETKTDAYFDTLAGWTHAYVNIEKDGAVEVEIARANGQPICTVAWIRSASDTFTPRVYAPGKYTVKAGKDKPDTVVAKAVEVA
jgi:hypothetical protein